MTLDRISRLDSTFSLEINKQVIQFYIPFIFLLGLVTQLTILKCLVVNQKMHHHLRNVVALEKSICKYQSSCHKFNCYMHR